MRRFCCLVVLSLVVAGTAALAQPSSGTSSGDTTGPPTGVPSTQASSETRPPEQAGAQPTTPATGFTFGTYGRVVVASDLRGHSGRSGNIVAYGTRLDLPTYAELEFHYDHAFGDVRTRMVATIGINGPLFHYSGDFSLLAAVRNLYMEESGALLRNLSVWVGSRMYRGDDIYLLNWWPLDNLNTVGGGARYDFGSSFSLAAHVGVNRLDDPYQLQTMSVAPRFGFGPVTALLLDRPRVIASLKGTYWFAGRTASAGFKLSLYSEYHSMASGVRQTESNVRELLPADQGYVVGAQFGGYTGVRNTFFNLFVRYGQGLGAYGDLRVPVAMVATRTSERAQDFVVAATGNWDLGPFALMAAGYVRYFRDADPNVFSRDALWEGTLVARPIVYFGQHAGLALEASYQSVVMDTLDPVTGSGPWRASVLRFGAIPFITPGGRGSFTRPHLQLIYLLTVRDEGARRLYAPDDPFGFNTVEHFLGIATEWWFNSSYL